MDSLIADIDRALRSVGLMEEANEQGTQIRRDLILIRDKLLAARTRAVSLKRAAQ